MDTIVAIFLIFLVLRRTDNIIRRGSADNIVNRNIVFGAIGVFNRCIILGYVIKGILIILI